MSLGFIEIHYHIRQRLFPGGEIQYVPVTGVQIGRFAVRKSDTSEAAFGLPGSDTAPWRVDHIPTGLVITAFDNFEEAYALADDISRFSLKDPATKDPQRAPSQSGDLIKAWVAEINRPWSEGEGLPKYIPYREWLATQGKEWRPRRRRMKPLKLFG